MTIRSEGTAKNPSGNASAWQVWGLIKQELLFLCWALMDVSLIAPVALIVMRWARFWDPGYLTLWFLLLILLPFNLVRLLSAAGATRKQQWRIILVALILVMLITWRGLLYAPRPFLDLSWLGEFFAHLGELSHPLWGRDFAVFLFVLFAWWRGMRLAQMTPEINRIGLRLRVGVLLLAPLALILHASGRLWDAMPYVLLYFLGGLTAVSLIRAEQIERERSGFAASLTPRWVLTIFLVSLLVVLTAALIAAIVSGDLAMLLTGRLAPLWAMAVATIVISLSTFLYLLTPAINLFTLLVVALTSFFSRLFGSLNLSLGSEPLLDLEVLLPFEDLVRQGDAPAFALSPLAIRALTLLSMLVVAAILTYFLTSFFRQPPISETRGSGAPGSGIPGEEDLALSERILRRLGLMRRWRAAASIRHIYTSMCRAAAAAGYPRVPAETPYEYLDTLADVWPDQTADSRLITEAYIRVRYGEIPETPGELAEIRAAWERLSSAQPGNIQHAPENE